MTDVLVAGSGSAGASAAIEARQAGADVLMIEALPKLGGSSAMSGGVVYAGGGTSLQRALGITDTVEDMYKFIVAAGSPHPQLDKIQLYCEQSAEHFDWLLEQGVHAIGKKVVEEAAESWMAAEYEGHDRTAEEIAQLLYFVQVLMIATDVSLDDVYHRL